MTAELTQSFCPKQQIIQNLNWEKKQHIYILYILFVFLDIDEEELGISKFRIKDGEKKLARLTGLGGIEICKTSARPTVTTGEEQVEEGRKSRSM